MDLLEVTQPWKDVFPGYSASLNFKTIIVCMFSILCVFSNHDQDSFYNLLKKKLVGSFIERFV